MELPGRLAYNTTSGNRGDIETETHLLDPVVDGCLFSLNNLGVDGGLERRGCTRRLWGTRGVSGAYCRRPDIGDVPLEDVPLEGFSETLDDPNGSHFDVRRCTKATESE